MNDDALDRIAAVSKKAGLYRDDIIRTRIRRNETSDVLKAATEQTLGPRQNDYGHPTVNLGVRTAALFAAYVQGMADPTNWTVVDVCNMMILVKVARLQQDPNNPHFDSLVDIAGYASSAWRGQDASR
jgi:hypothetical protein